uniref:Uncharacterized protein n=1 Tax=Candidatus Kentrum eta TaxID=2126337 RepID=A0A450UWG9_9GAMM|nr:MAG: hypothetical protein BECKH772A_GA0070896_1001016 [Candidatus Kentron sp. H]VFJ90716.1 MAG: hypothetical protein BECKH772B_GA0070898_1001116 [Candidatus Kentron sp. H]VFJ96870.1 MAG: hypothetical protein BECKH772C_GA0070978_1000916 [Candidatus Kentron sp. H]
MGKPAEDWEGLPQGFGNLPGILRDLSRIPPDPAQGSDNLSETLGNLARIPENPAQGFGKVSEVSR